MAIYCIDEVYSICCLTHLMLSLTLLLLTRDVTASLISRRAGFLSSVRHWVIIAALILDFRAEEKQAMSSGAHINEIW